VGNRCGVSKLKATPHIFMDIIDINTDTAIYLIRERELERLQKDAQSFCVCTSQGACRACIAETAIAEIKRFRDIEARVNVVIEGTQ
jgi:hypothetical protein